MTRNTMTHTRRSAQRFLFGAMLLAGAALTPLATQAAFETINGIQYEYILINNGLAVKIGDGNDSAIDKGTAGTLILPDVLGGIRWWRSTGGRSAYARI